MASVIPTLPNQYFDDNGDPLSGGKVYTFEAGTTTPKTTWSDAGESVANSNPLILDAAGRAKIYWRGTYDVEVRNSANVLITTMEDVADGAAAADTLRTDLANTTDPAKGDALIGVKRTVAGATAETQHAVNERADFYVEQFGAVGDGTTDDGPAFRAAADAAYAAGGGTVRCARGKTYRLVAAGTPIYGNTYAVVLRDKVNLRVNASTINCEVGTGNQLSVWIYGSYVEIALEGGAINAVSSGTPSSQFFYHAGIGIGIQNNCGDTVASPSPGHGLTGWKIHGGRVSTNRTHCPAIQGMSSCNDFDIDVEIPDSAFCSGVHFDWGNVGVVSSGDIPGTKTAYLAGQCYTTHPHNGRIKVKTGNLSVAPAGDLGANGVRLSACHGIVVDGVEAESLTLAGYLHTGGDLGYEFALDEDKPHAYKGNICRSVEIKNPSSLTQCVFVDTLADNIYRQQFISGYLPITNPLYDGNVVIEDCDFVGAATVGQHGIRITQARGVEVRNNSIQNCDIGIFVDELTQDIEIVGNKVFNNMSHGIQVGFDTVRENTERIGVRRNRCFANGTAGTGHGVFVARCRTGWVDDNILGTIDEGSQDSGLAIADNGVNWNVNARRNHVLGSTASPYSIGGSVAPYYLNQLGEFSENTAELSCPMPLVNAQSQVPHRSLMQVSRWAKEYINNNAGSPSAGHWYTGSILWQRTPLPSNPAITSVTTSGTFGTLSALTNGSTTATSNQITCGLTGLTANSVSTQYTITVSSAANMRVGLLVSVAAAGITNARIVQISGTTLYLDTQVTTTQVGGALVCAGVIEGEVISINTTTPVAGAVVMKVNGNTVTLDQAPVDTQSGRTLSYTAPVFKNHANISA